MGPYALPCDPEAARVLTKGKEGPKTRKGLSFAKQKFFEPCPQRQVQCEHCGAKGGRKGNPEPGELSAKALLEQETAVLRRWEQSGALPINEAPVTGQNRSTTWENKKACT